MRLTCAKAPFRSLTISTRAERHGPRHGADTYTHTYNINADSRKVQRDCKIETNWSQSTKNIEKFIITMVKNRNVKFAKF